MDILSQFLPFVATALASIISALVIWFAKNKMKLNLTKEQESLLSDIVHRAIAFAEEWARNQIKNGVTVSSSAKLEQAISFAQSEIARTKLNVKLSAPQIKALLESVLPFTRPASKA